MVFLSGDSEGVREASDTHVIMSANEETVKKEVLEAQEAEETNKAEDTQNTPDMDEKPVEEKETEEQQRPFSRDDSDKDTVCAVLPCPWTHALGRCVVPTKATFGYTHDTDCATSLYRKLLRTPSRLDLSDR